MSTRRWAYGLRFTSADVYEFKIHSAGGEWYRQLPVGIQNPAAARPPHRRVVHTSFWVRDRYIRYKILAPESSAGHVGPGGPGGPDGPGWARRARLGPEIRIRRH